MHTLRRLGLTVLCAAVVAGAQAQTVALSGMMGGKALLLVDGRAPKSVAPGETYLGVKLVSAANEEAVVEIAGKRATLHMGESPVSVKGKGAGNKIVLTADSQGHFIGPGKINGQAMQFVVDTGATAVSLSVNEAERIGINYKTGQQVNMSTANGNSVGWRVRLASVRIGDVELPGVEAVITPASMPYVLLGNSFLTQFQMTRINDQMVLERRY
ncbi:TIGR02281 family clan AA aspartic protease [Rhodoferax sp.]|uniref:retropepsin-like aspartic protease family protein n=1 Tax=Rhodoferax sp. TaxID=50421 RepID=UPI0025F07DF7|nr:TIGR02281 family clan AA aspartic protease [Rhodoferax sp.]